MILTIAACLTVGVLLFTFFVRAQDIPEPEQVSPTQHLEDRKKQIYENLRDLNFEFRVGKLSDEDYQKTKLGLQGELAAVLAEIDKTKPMVPPAPAPKGKAPKAVPANVCPHCGAKFPQPLKFCGECGKPMAGAVA